MPSSWTQSYFHIVFGTKQRTAWLDADLRPRLCSFLGGIARSLRCQLIAANGTQDHVHLLIRCSPEVALATLAREVKSRSSAWMHETFPNRRAFGWQRGYGGFTVSHSAVAAVKRYILEQERHHKRMTWEEEFEQFLERHEVPFVRGKLID